MYTEIKTVEDAYQATGKTQPEIQGENAELLKNINHLIVVSEAIRENWTPDYNNSNEWKYMPWFELKTRSSNPSGFRFFYSYGAYTSAHAVLGPLLCQQSREKSEYFATQFEEVFRKIMK